MNIKISPRRLTLTLAVIPAASVIIDYILTFYLAGSQGMVIEWEASPLVRYAVTNNLMVFYIAAIALFYYGAAYFVFSILEGTPLYKFGVVLVFLISSAHLLGGMSWYFRTPQYSYSVMALSYFTIIIAFLTLAYAIVRERSGNPART